MTRQQTIEKAVTWALQIAQDPAHGYDQAHRWGPDYDCSSLMISAWQQAGVPVKAAGATYTGNMFQAFLRCGFKDVTAEINLNNGTGLQRGDVLLNAQHHTAMSIGGGQIVHALSHLLEIIVYIIAAIAVERLFKRHAADILRRDHGFPPVCGQSPLLPDFRVLHFIRRVRDSLSQYW